LTRAQYPTTWDQHGYPPRPIIPAVVGDIIHRSLDVVLRALYEQRCASITDPAATQALRSLGGYSGLVEREIERQLDLLQTTPRMATRVGAFKTVLRARMPDMRQRLQTMVARATLVPTAVGVKASRTTSAPMSLGDGSHPEVPLRAGDLRLAGRADLITVRDEECSIVDYKTGAPDDHHVEQVRLYQLLWSRDRSVNPTAIPVRSLTLAYASHDKSVEPLDDDGLNDLAAELVARMRDAEIALEMRPPPARPAPDLCRLCSVRHLCDDYWASATAHDHDGDFVDCEGTVISQNGPRSWLVDVDRPKRERVLLRTLTEQPGFTIGNGIRVLDAGLARDEDTGRAVLTLTQSSEVFHLARTP
jgi:hypothetical protein